MNVWCGRRDGGGGYLPCDGLLSADPCAAVEPWYRHDEGGVLISELSIASGNRTECRQARTLVRLELIVLHPQMELGREGRDHSELKPRSTCWNECDHTEQARLRYSMEGRDRRGGNLDRTTRPHAGLRRRLVFVASVCFGDQGDRVRP